MYILKLFIELLYVVTHTSSYLQTNTHYLHYSKHYINTRYDNGD